MCTPKPPKPKKVVTPPPQYLVNPLTDNLTTRGFLDARAGRNSLVIRPGSPVAAPGAAPLPTPSGANVTAPGSSVVLPTPTAPGSPNPFSGARGRALSRTIMRALA
jgi:hypothetical protein